MSLHRMAAEIEPEHLALVGQPLRERPLSNRRESVVVLHRQSGEQSDLASETILLLARCHLHHRFQPLDQGRTRLIELIESTRLDEVLHDPSVDSPLVELLEELLLLQC